MTTKQLKKVRTLRAVEQRHRCFYCQFPMWSKRPTKFARRYGISVAEAKRFKRTAEHVLPLQDGGTSRQENIVAACYFCNHERHHRKKPLPAERFVLFVRRRITRLGWHPPWLHRMVAT